MYILFGKTCNSKTFLFGVSFAFSATVKREKVSKAEHIVKQLIFQAYSE